MDAGANSQGNYKYGFICESCGLKVDPETNMYETFKGKTFIDKERINLKSKEFVQIPFKGV
jgi:hypothetical protein